MVECPIGAMYSLSGVLCGEHLLVETKDVLPGCCRWHANMHDDTLHLTTLESDKPAPAGKEDGKSMQHAAAHIPLHGCTVCVVTEGLRHVIFDL